VTAAASKKKRNLNIYIKINKKDMIFLLDWSILNNPESMFCTSGVNRLGQIILLFFYPI
jgi:hypothetical protein